MSKTAKPKTPATPDAPRRAADRIRDTAAELFYREGIRAIGVEEIVNRAGVTKPSLYRAFESKDELAAAYLRDYDQHWREFFEAHAAAHPGDARAHLLAYLAGLAERATMPGYRGCGLTNAVIEYPEPKHPARLVATHSKQHLRARLTEMSKQMGARNPAELADSLLLLIEGCYASGQTFGAGGPARAVVRAAEQLIDAAR